ncbi:MAG TPA: hypothetical protein VIJ71_06870 [Mycobacteriales bacterium]
MGRQVKVGDVDEDGAQQLVVKAPAIEVGQQGHDVRTSGDVLPCMLVECQAR